MYQKNDIISMFRNGYSRREIARRLGLARNTVNKYVKEYLIKNEELSKETSREKSLSFKRE